MVDYEKIKFKLALMGLTIRRLDLGTYKHATIIESDGHNSERTAKDGFYIYHQSDYLYENAEKAVLEQWMNANGKF